MKNRYSVVDEQATPHIVLATYPFAWMARAVCAARGGERLGYGVATTPTDPQVFIQVCHHRDELLATLYGDSGRGELVDVLWGLVTRGEDGRWETVHDTQVPLPDAAQKILDRVLA